MNYGYLGIDVGGTNTKLCVLDAELNILHTFKCATDKSKDIVVFITQLIDQYIQKFPFIKRVCLGLPGIVDLEKGVVHTAPSIINGKRNLKKEIQEKINLPVYLDNDVACWAIAEGKIGACKDMQDYVLVSLGTGIGATIVIEKKVYRGWDYAAGEVGYMVFLEDLYKSTKSCDEFGSFETKASPGAIVKEYQALTNSSVELEMLFQAFKNKENKAAQAFIQKKWDYLSIGIANIITLLHPQCVVVAGGITAQWDYLFGEINSRIQQLICTNTKIVPSATGAYGAAIGAVISAINQEKSLL